MGEEYLFRSMWIFQDKDIISERGIYIFDRDGGGPKWLYDLGLNINGYLLCLPNHHFPIFFQYK